jgi:hypothetical protein
MHSRDMNNEPLTSDEKQAVLNLLAREIRSNRAQAKRSRGTDAVNWTQTAAESLTLLTKMESLLGVAYQDWHQLED